MTLPPTASDGNFVFGLTFKGEPISKRRIKRLWRSIAKNAPLPNVNVVRLSRSMFEHLGRQLNLNNALRGNPKVTEQAAIREWGESVPLSNTDAFVIWVERGYLICVSPLENSPEEDYLILHELTHILLGEVPHE